MTLTSEAILLVAGCVQPEGARRVRQTRRGRGRERVGPQTRRARLPWFLCLRCGQRLFQVDVRDGWTCARVGRAWTSGNIKAVCPNCGTVRRFDTRSVG